MYFIYFIYFICFVYFLLLLTSNLLTSFLTQHTSLSFIFFLHLLLLFSIYSIFFFFLHLLHLCFIFLIFLLSSNLLLVFSVCAQGSSPGLLQGHCAKLRTASPRFFGVRQTLNQRTPRTPHTSILSLNLTYLSSLFR